MAINLEEKVLYGVGEETPIIRWEVWFLVPMHGPFKDLDAAISTCKGVDWLPNEVIIPVPVAIGEDETYEVRIG